MSTLGSITYHLAKRGMEAADEKPSDPNQPDRPFPVLGFTVVFATALLMFIMTACVSYSYGLIVTTLAAVEDPHPDVYVRIDGDNIAVNPEQDSELPVFEPKPVTSSLRRTIAHLRARAGTWSRFRGIRMYILTALATKIIVSPLSILMGGNLFGHAIARFIAEVIVANLTVAWVHIVISEPSPKRFWQRIPGRKTMLKIAPAAALRSLASQITFFTPLIVGYATHIFKNGGAMNPIIPSDEIPPTKVIGGSLGVFVLGMVLYLLIEMPAEVTFIRVAASMLPEEDETIVPFDRSFGGKVTPEIIGGQGKIGIVDAWRSFDWASRVRFVKVVAKVSLIQIALGALFTIVLVVQVYFFLGDSIKKSITALNAPTVEVM